MKDLSDLHIAAVESGQPEMFRKTVEAIVWRARLRQEERKHLSTSLGNVKVDDTSLTSFGAVRFASLGDPQPPRYLVRNCIEVGEPTYIYGGPGTLKSIKATALAIAIASPEVSEILGYAVEEHGPVVIYDSEMNQHKFLWRIKEICNGLSIAVPNNLFYINAVGVPPREAFSNLHGLVDHVRAIAAVIDSWGFSTRGDPEDYSDMRNDTAKYINPLLSKGIPTVIVEHKPHQGYHLFGSVIKGYHGRFIFRVDDLDKDDRVKGERNTRLINEKASFTDEGQKMSIVTRFEKGSDENTPGSIVIENVGATDGDKDPTDKGAQGRLKVRQSLKGHNLAKRQLSTATRLKENYLSNLLPKMVRDKEIYVVNTESGGTFVYGLNPPGSPSQTSTTPRDVNVDDTPLTPSETLINSSNGDETFKDFAPRLITEHTGIEEVVSEVATSSVIAVDLETGPPELGLDPIRCTPGALSITTETGYTAVINLNRVHPARVLTAIQAKTLLGHNLRFDLRVLRHSFGYEHRAGANDTYVLKQMIHFADGERKPDKGKLKVPQYLPPLEIDGLRIGKPDVDGDKVGTGSLRGLAYTYLNEDLSKEKQRSDWLAEEFTQSQVDYAGRDTYILFALWVKLEAEYRNIVGRALADLRCTEVDPGRILQLEADDRPAKVWMEGNGFAINTNKWHELAEHYQAVALETEEELRKMAGDPDINLDSDQQVIVTLERLGADLGKVPKTETTKRPSLAKDNITKVKGSDEVHKFVALYQRRAEAAKYFGTYGHKWLIAPEEMYEAGIKKNQIPDHQYVVGGRVYSIFDMARTGRDRSYNQNLQNLPSATKSGHRAALEVPEDRCLLIADYRQIELVVLAVVAGDKEMYAALSDPNRDLHSEMVYELWGLEDDGSDDFADKRKKAKNVNFGRAYLRGAASIATQYGMPKSDAQALIDAYDRHWKDVNTWHRREKARAKRFEKTATLAGRVRKISTQKRAGQNKHTIYVPEWVNHQVQGTAGDGMKLARINLYRTKDGVPGNPLLVDSVHDELVVECDRSSADEVARWLESHMVNSMREMLEDPNAPVHVEIKPPATNYAAVKELDNEL